MKLDQKSVLSVPNHTFQFMNNGIAILNHERIITFCNSSLCTILKKKENELFGRHITPILLELENDFIINEIPIYLNEQENGLFIIFETKQLDSTDIQLLQKRIVQFENALHILSECILGVDEQGIVNFLSSSYAQFLGIDDPKDAIGKHCTEVVENTRMHIVVKTGQAEVGQIQRVNNQNIIATRMPVIENGKVIGAIGKIMFHDVEQVKVLADQISTMESKLSYYQTELKRLQEARYSFQSIIGESEKMLKVKNEAMKLAKSRSTVLIQGESGTGKELFAHAIHNASPRATGSFIRLNCAAIPRDLLEAELFGYEEGAFTGAKKGGKPGKIELSDKGTLFLDEIGDMPLDMQAKLLRVLQEKEIERIGGTKTRKIDVRFIAATHQNLFQMVQEGVFREDLYYRLHVCTIDIPSLRERKEDIKQLTAYLIGKLNTELGTFFHSIDERVHQLFASYNWPGNIRELENILERAMNMAEHDCIQAQYLPLSLQKQNTSMNLNREESILEDKREGNCSLQEEIEAAEKRAIQRALKQTFGNRKEAAELLGIHRASLYRKIEKYELCRESSSPICPSS